MRKFFTNKSGFTLIEILLVIAIIAVLAAAVVIAINPAKNISDARNTQRRSDVNAILGVLSQSFIDNVVPSGVVVPDCGVANAGALDIGTGVGLVNLATVAFVPTYIASIPMDPQSGTQADTLYKVCASSASPVRYRVLAPNAENSVVITVER